MRGTGLKGRIGIYELFIPDEAIADLLTANVPIHQVRMAAINSGMRSLLVDAMDKARAGIIPVSEVIRLVPYRMLGEI